MENKFPILSSEPKEYISWDVIKAHENQALKNHGQTLKRLAERGGLSWIEALCVLEDREYDYNISEIDAKAKIFKIIETISVEREESERSKAIGPASKGHGADQVQPQSNSSYISSYQK